LHAPENRSNPKLCMSLTSVPGTRSGLFSSSFGIGFVSPAVSGDEVKS
jgi:hypothetical protein